MANVWDYGDLVRVQGSFTDANSVAQDPTSVYFQIKNPWGSVSAYTYGSNTQVVRSATGVYHVDVSADAVGWWKYRWYSSGAGQASGEGEFRVQESEFD